MNKKDLRAVCLAGRKSLSPEESEAISKDIATLFFQSFPLDNVRCLHIFLPILDKMEINTQHILHKLRLDFPHIIVALSKSNFKDFTMMHFRYEEHIALKENAYGIPEPTAGTRVDASEIDMAVIPLLAFDNKGNRLGYGKGFYDRFLKDCRPDCIKIGLSKDGPVPLIEAESFDVPLDFCITPSRLYDFGRRE